MCCYSSIGGVAAGIDAGIAARSDMLGYGGTHRGLSLLGPVALIESSDGCTIDAGEDRE